MQLNHLNLLSQSLSADYFLFFAPLSSLHLHADIIRLDCRSFSYVNRRQAQRRNSNSCERPKLFSSFQLSSTSAAAASRPEELQSMNAKAFTSMCPPVVFVFVLVSSFFRSFVTLRIRPRGDAAPLRWRGCIRGELCLFWTTLFCIWVNATAARLKEQYTWREEMSWYIRGGADLIS